MISSRSSATKNKILETASELFAVYGYEGTSIRDISKSAKVNLSAVNYHFQNKEYLYWETFVSSINVINHAAESIDTNISAPDFAWELFKKLRLNAKSVINTFKMLLSGSMPEPPESYQAACQQTEIGPPGGKMLGQTIKNQIPTISNEQLKWAVKSIFTYLVHIAMILETNYVQRMPTFDREFSDKNLEKDVRLHAQAIISYLVSSK